MRTKPFRFAVSILAANGLRQGLGAWLNALKNCFLGDVLVGGDGSEDRVQSPDPERRMRGNGDAVGSRSLGLKDDVSADLVDSLVVPKLAEVLDQGLAAQIAWEFHAIASTSSRTRCRRMEAGAAESK